MKLKSYIFFVLTLISCFQTSSCYDNDDLAIFDLVELINENFYTFLGISQDASLSEIKRAFRNLSIILHPDKNSAEDANIQFRNLVEIYDVLKNPVKREKYDNVLKNGLPNWKSAIYYYRKARKIGLIEGSLLLFVIITIGQYLVAWAVYMEKKYTMAQLFESKSKKTKKVDIDSILNNLPKPSFKNTLPFQIPIGIYTLIIRAPNAVNLLAEEMKKELEIKRKEKEEEDLLKKIESERQQHKEERKNELRRRKEQHSKFQERTDEELASYSAIIKHTKDNSEIKTKIPLNGGLWTDTDLVELARLMKKYPGGSNERWETIANIMQRNVSEVTFMAYKLKDNVYQNPGETEKFVEQVNKEITKKLKTKSSDTLEASAEKGWTQEQQKALENAIQRIGKRCDDRWTKIAKSVSGKTKEECLARYVFLVKKLNSTKQAESQKTEEKVEKETIEIEPSAKPTASSVSENIEDSSEPIAVESANSSNNLGKKRNRRKELKKNIDYFAEDDSENDSC